MTKTDISFQKFLECCVNGGFEGKMNGDGVVYLYEEELIFHNFNFVDDINFLLFSEQQNQPINKKNTIKKLKFYKCIFQKPFFINDFLFTETETITIQECEFVNDSGFIGLKLETLEFILCSFNLGFSVINCSLKELKFANCNSHEEFVCHKNEIEKLEIQGGNYSEAEFYGTTNDDQIQDKKYSQAGIKKIFISKNLNKSSLLFWDILPEKIWLFSVKNGTLQLSNVSFEESSSFIIHESDLSLIRLNNIDFSKLQDFKIRNSDLSVFKTSSVTWKYKIEPAINEHINEELTKKQTLASQRDTYRQLKFAMEKQADRIEALRFYEKEMQVFLQSLNFKQNPGDYICLWFSEITNKHGLSWLLSFFQFFLLSLWCYLMTIKALNTDFTVTLPNYEFMSGWFNFINPGNLDFVSDQVDEGAQKNSQAVVFFFIWKILSFLLLYQIISAFRKYTKKL